MPRFPVIFFSDRIRSILTGISNFFVRVIDHGRHLDFLADIFDDGGSDDKPFMGFISTAVDESQRVSRRLKHPFMTEIESVGFKLLSDEKDDESGGDLKIGAYDEWRKEFSRGIRPCSSVHCFLLCSEISIHRRSGRIPPLNESKLISAS